MPLEPAEELTCGYVETGICIGWARKKFHDPNRVCYRCLQTYGVDKTMKHAGDPSRVMSDIAKWLEDQAKENDRGQYACVFRDVQFADCEFRATNLNMYKVDCANCPTWGHACEEHVRVLSQEEDAQLFSQYFTQDGKLRILDDKAKA